MNNTSAFSLSHQCDILVFEVNNTPIVFRDEDFVVVRPESVRVIIEVKGALSVEETNNTVDSCVKFAEKWQQTKLFYSRWRLPKLRPPGLMLMGWNIKTNKNGVRVTNPGKVREAVASRYFGRLPGPDIDPNLPVLNNLFIYNECAIDCVTYCYTEPERYELGWHSSRGQYVKLVDGSPRVDKDRTIALLLAAVHRRLRDEPQNDFFADDISGLIQNPIPYEYEGFSKWRDLPNVGEPDSTERDS